MKSVKQIYIKGIWEIIKFPSFDVIHIILYLTDMKLFYYYFFTNNIIQLFVKRKITSLLKKYISRRSLSIFNFLKNIK